jgi:glycosyltransferase involved in cell wall biosynthesis
MKITFVIASLGPGGAERVLSTMANYWADSARDITLITVSGIATDWYPLNPCIQRVALDLTSISLGIGEAIQYNVRRVIRLRQAFRKSRADVIISFGDTTNVLALLASQGLGIPVIVSERTNPLQHSIGWAWSRLRSMLYLHAHAIVVQSNAVRDWAKTVVKEHLVHTIPNPVNHDPARSIPRPQSFGRTVVAMGRLAVEKGFDVLLRAFSRCVQKHNDWTLIIVGEGNERRFLETLVLELGLSDRVHMPGLVQNPMPILQGADLFVLSSRYEGFPNALLEAMACGLAVIATDCSSGLGEIIRDGVDGVLIPPNDVEAMVSSMTSLMQDEAIRQRLGSQAVQVTERFGVQKIMSVWDNLLTKVCKGQAA